MKTYKQRTDDILTKAQKKRKAKKTAIAATISSCACAAAVALACVLFIPLPQPSVAVDIYRESEYFPVIERLDKKLNPVSEPVYKNNFERWTAELKDFFGGFFGSNTAKGDRNDVVWDEDAPTMSGSTSLGPADGNDYSNGYVETTDNQVQGVVEGDIFKRTKTHIFYLYDDTVYAYNIAGSDTSLVSVYEIRARENSRINASATEEAYLSSDGRTLTVVRGIFAFSKEGKSKAYTEIIGLDVSDPVSICERGRNYLSGSYVSSRTVDGKLLVVNNYYVYKGADFSEESSFLPMYGAWGEMRCVAADNIVCPEELTTTNYSVICQIDEKDFKTEACTALLSYSSSIYVSAENIFVTRAYREKQDDVTQTKTEVACVAYGNGNLEYVNSVTVEGSVLNQYSMDEYDGCFRIVTTTDAGATNASLYCIDMQTFETVGKAEHFAPDGESVQSVRFDGDKAFVCTAVVITLTDPVYAFDLSDPTNITYVDTGEIKGYSSSLIDFRDGFLLGIGFRGNGGLKLEIYRETATSMESVALYELDASFSSVYKSYFIDRERGLVGLGIYDYTEDSVFKGYILLSFDGYTLNEIVRTKLRGDCEQMRATLIDGYFYMLGADECKTEKIF